MNKITLLIHCKDQSGIIASVTKFVADNSGNIVYIDQHVDREQDIFFMRLESEFSNPSFSMNSFKEIFANTLTKKFQMMIIYEWPYSFQNTIIVYMIF